ncbi:unnamed protein product (macronuclear) [Paramecium tetraurelia]|uniref:Cyclin-dependent kinase 2 homolog n=1 Tax=Paramecium tetraurelia TaxID=5888 RepID=A0DXY1_PARTE|nr:uncharacterized protein GSPATT00021522001 [Paramecium tetraurelia]CAK87898.1 unnamed protein product [Paramecium tetraurelia]|eukprot:XP_001455295.1 hypothetical protein (macronuclear) [Paramecium tetraurelia strain d4-2]
MKPVFSIPSLKFSYGVVRKVFDKQRSKSVGLKGIKLNDEGVPNKTMREKGILQMLKHPNITKYFIEQKKIFLKKIQMKINQQIQIGQSESQITQFQVYRIVMRSLTRELFIKWDDSKIANFGLSKVFPISIKKFPSEVCIQYRASEILLGDDNEVTSADIWAIGCIIAECLNRQPLFRGDGQIFIVCNIMFKFLGTPSNDNYFGQSKIPHFRLNFSKFRAENLTSIKPIFDRIQYDEFQEQKIFKYFLSRIRNFKY